MTDVKVGVSLHDSVMVADAGARRALVDGVVDAGLDHVTLGDHVSFHGGTGFDGLLSAAAVLAAHDTVHVLLAVYQLALRHPMVVARQLASLSQLAPGRLTFGVGVGGEDRAEIANCGVDPATRGRRLDESVRLVRRLGSGEPVTYGGEFFTLDAAAVLPPVVPPVPIVVGGSGDVAIRRTAALGDGWVGLFCTPRRFAATRASILEAAAAAGRSPDWFGLSLWCGVDDDERVARTRLGEQMQALYRLPPERFGHLTAAGPAERIAEFLVPYVEGGAEHVSLVPVAADPDHAVAGAADVRRLLRSV